MCGYNLLFQSMDIKQIQLLKDFIDLVKKDATIYHLPELLFFKEFLQR